MTLLLPSRPDSRRSRCPPAALPSKPFTHRLLLLHLSRHAVPPRSDSADRAAPTDSCFLIPPTPFVGTARRSRRSLANVLSAHHHTALHAFHLHSTAHLLLSVHYSPLRPPLAANAAHYLSFTLTRWHTHRHPVSQVAAAAACRRRRPHTLLDFVAVI